MSSLRGRVQGGHIVIEDAVDLPEGTELHLQVVDFDDDLDEEDRRLLNLSIERGIQEIERGEGIPAEQVAAQLWRAVGR